MHFVGADGQSVATRNLTVPVIRPYVELAGAPDGPRRWATHRAVWLSNPWLYAAIQLRVGGLARMELQARTLDSDGNPKIITPFAATRPGRPDASMQLAKLLVRPEHRKHRRTWLRQLWSDRQVYGNGLIVFREPEDNPTSIPSNLRWVPWPLVQVIPATDADDYGPGVVAYRETRPRGGHPVMHSPENVIHLGRSSHPWTPEGEAPIQSLSATMALFDALQRHLVAFFKNSARPSGYMQVQPGTSKENMKVIREEVMRLYSGPENAGKPLVTSAEWKTLTADHKSSAIIELIQLSREEIAAAYNIPPPIMGILDRAIKSNVQELRSFHLRDVVGPDADEFVGDLMAQMIWDIPQWNGLEAAFDMSGPLRPDLEARATVYGQMRHVWTPNEMRRMEGFYPLDGVAGEYADTVWMPSGQVPLGLVQPQTLSDTYGELPTDPSDTPEGAPTTPAESLPEMDDDESDGGSA